MITIIADKDIKQIPTKECARCRKLGRSFVKPEEEFSLKSDGKRHSYCKPCRAEQTNEWNADEDTKARRAQYQRDYRAARRTKVYYGNAYKRQANKPILPNNIGTDFSDAVSIEVVNGELKPVTNFQHLYLTIECEAVHISVRKD